MADCRLPRPGWTTDNNERRCCHSPLSQVFAVGNPKLRLDGYPEPGLVVNAHGSVGERLVDDRPKLIEQPQPVGLREQCDVAVARLLGYPAVDGNFALPRNGDAVVQVEATRVANRCSPVDVALAAMSSRTRALDDRPAVVEPGVSIGARVRPPRRPSTAVNEYAVSLRSSARCVEPVPGLSETDQVNSAVSDGKNCAIRKNRAKTRGAHCPPAPKHCGPVRRQ